MRLSTPLEHGGDHVPPIVAVGAGQRAQIGEQTRPFLSIGPNGFVLVDEGEQLIAGDALRVGRPVAPAVGRLDGRPEFLPGKRRLLFPLQSPGRRGISGT